MNLSASLSLQGLAVHLWQATLFGLVMALAVAFLPGPARVRQMAGWLALLRFLLPMGVLASLTGLSSLMTAVAWRPAALGAWWMPAFVVSGSASHPHVSPALVLALVWGAGAGAVMMVGMIRLRRGQRSVDRDQAPFSDADRRRLDGLAVRVGLRPGHVAGRYVSSNAWMGVVGVRHPRVLVPRGLLEALELSEAESVLLHELVHVKRRDNLLRLLQAAVVTAFWFHPLVWWLERRLRWESERACDEAVLRLTGANEAYASGLCKATRHALGLDLPGISAMSRMRLQARVRAVLHHHNRKESPVKPVLTIAALIGLFSLTTLLAAAPATPAQAADETASAPEAIQTPKVSVYDYGDLDEPPVIVEQTRPLYPAKLHRAGQTGQVNLAFVVDRDGKVTDLKVIKSTDQRFDEAAMTAVRQWKFTPGRKNGQTVSVRMAVPIVFALSPGM